MNTQCIDCVVIGGGAAGMAAAYKVFEAGLSVAIVEREEYLGGILLQCIHNGFGVHEFKEELTGPEYADKYTQLIGKSAIRIFTSTTVVDIIDSGDSKNLICYSAVHGTLDFKAKAIVLAMGCRERNRGNIGIAGTRPSGIFTAGYAQRLINIDGFVPGKRAVIIGSGDIGLIMARRLSWIGSTVSAVIEINPYPSGLTRNISQCLNDFGIPLYLSHTVSRVRGKNRVEGVDVTPLDQGKPDFSKTFGIECDTILLSVGLIPENELSKKAGVLINPDTGGAYVDANFMTSKQGIFACGNVLHVHDLVDKASEEAKMCAGFVCAYIKGTPDTRMQHKVVSGSNVIYVVPNYYVSGRDNLFFLRSFIVKNNARLVVSVGGELIREKKLVHVQPSEMIDLELEKQELEKIDEENAAMEISIL
jgi:NADPH-dependent 2,4-dienoyl-CoA reductase/sulfur reductase-like enzyme